MVAGSPSVAVRMYDIHDVQRLEKELSSDDNNHDENNGGVDGLKHFRQSYEHSIVFFILASSHQRDQLGRRDSFFHLAQRTNIRILIVADVSQAISAITSVVQSIAPEKREKKRKYFAQIAEENYLTSSMVKGGIEPTQETVANYAKKTMITWAERMDTIQQGDINVALDMLGSIGNVATASNSDLDNIPITALSKDTIRHFFGGLARDKKEGANGNGNNPADSELFGDIDDSELLNIPDPSPAPDNFDQNMQYQRESYDEYDLHPEGHGHTSYEHSSYQTQARDFYTPINPSFARRRLDHGRHQQDHGHGGFQSQYGYDMEMNYNTGQYPSSNNYHRQGDYDDFGYSQSRSLPPSGRDEDDPMYLKYVRTSEKSYGGTGDCAKKCCLMFVAVSQTHVHRCISKNDNKLPQDGLSFCRYRSMEATSQQSENNNNNRPNAPIK
eukprot:scaffold1938_cov114-Skeletonema_dohrnii-CCMP3373.AAC.5